MVESEAIKTGLLDPGRSQQPQCDLPIPMPITFVNFMSNLFVSCQCQVQPYTCSSDLSVMKMEIREAKLGLEHRWMFQFFPLCQSMRNGLLLTNIQLVSLKIRVIPLYSIFQFASRIFESVFEPKHRGIQSNFTNHKNHKSQLCSESFSTSAMRILNS